MAGHYYEEGEAEELLALAEAHQRRSESTERFETREDSVVDRRTGLEWQLNHSGPMSWFRAVEYAEGLGDGWRLPTMPELATLIDWETQNPASTFPGMVPCWFWSSASYACSSSRAWNAGFYYGFAGHGDKTNANYVRCVRARLSDR